MLYASKSKREKRETERERERKRGERGKPIHVEKIDGFTVLQ